MAITAPMPGTRADATTLRRAHLVVGSAGALAFIGTGVFMKLGFPALYESNEAIRFTLRANHIYLLLASLINILLAIYLRFDGTGWRRAIAGVGSGAVLLAPFVLWAAFLVEGPTASPERLITFVGIVLLLAGVAAHVPGRPRGG